MPDRSWLLALLLAPAAAVAQETQASDELAVAFQERLEELWEADGFPGATAAFLLKDGRGAEVAVGLADVENDIPMRPDHRMLAASIGKTFVGASVLLLNREGRLDLDDKVSKWLGHEPWFDRLPNAATITVRSLANHTGGLPTHAARPFIEDWARKIQEDPGYAPTPEEAISYILDEPPLFGVGEGLEYSETGFLVLGLVIERACSCDYYDFIRERFLEPLKLEHTVPADGPVISGMAVGYMGDTEGSPHLALLPERTLRDGRLVPNPAFEFTGGGVVSTAGDLTRWAHALYGGRAIEAPYLQELLTGVPNNPENVEFWYGVGTYIYRRTSGGAVYGHGGSTANYRSQLLYYPKEGLAVAVQVNRWRKVPAGRYASELAQLVLEALEQEGER